MPKRKFDGNGDGHGHNHSINQDGSGGHVTKRLRPSILPPLPPIKPEFEKYVFTHPSAASKPAANGEAIHYDRLEFIGDAHLELIASTYIYDTYPTATAGRMAQIRQQLVQNETLCQYSQMYDFDKRLKMSIGSPDNNNHHHHHRPHHQQHQQNQTHKLNLTKIYGDVFEAYIGAIFRSDPVSAPSLVSTWLHALWAPLWSDLLLKFPPEVSGQKEALARKLVVPGVRLDYVEEKKPIVHVGKGIETFFIGVYLTGWGYTNQHLGSAKAASKVQAGQEAARAALANSVWMDRLVARKEEWLREREVMKREKAEGSTKPAKSEPGG